ncbi:MAG TPA: hypothetical protein VLB12_09195, partial [Gemmatimonadales bacterium]|nr:hypothetical protein [Gemmatimonadales bacterium]
GPAHARRPLARRARVAAGRTRFTDYYLPGDGSLTTDLPREPSSATAYRFDPARPVPSIGGNVSSLRDVLPLPPGLADPSYAGRAERTVDVMRPGGFDQREAPASTAAAHLTCRWAPGPTCWCFRRRRSLKAMEVAGPIEVHLWVATSAVDTDFTAKLIDVLNQRVQGSSPWQSSSRIGGFQRIEPSKDCFQPNDTQALLTPPRRQAPLGLVDDGTA